MLHIAATLGTTRPTDQITDWPIERYGTMKEGESDTLSERKRIVHTQRRSAYILKG